MTFPAMTNEEVAQIHQNRQFLFILKTKKCLGRGWNTEFSKQRRIKSKRIKHHHKESSSVTFPAITKREVAQIHQNRQFSKNSIFRFSEKTSKNHKKSKNGNFSKNFVPPY